MQQPDREAGEMRILQPPAVQLLRKKREKEENRPPLHLQELLEQHRQEKHVQERELIFSNPAQNQDSSSLSFSNQEDIIAHYLQWGTDHGWDSAIVQGS